MVIPQTGKEKGSNPEGAKTSGALQSDSQPVPTENCGLASVFGPVAADESESMAAQAVSARHQVGGRTD